MLRRSSNSVSSHKRDCDGNGKRHYFNQETVMLISLSLVALLVLFGATVAWFVGSKPVSIVADNVRSDDLGDLYVYVKCENTGTSESSGETEATQPSETQTQTETSQTETSETETSETGTSQTETSQTETSQTETSETETSEQESSSEETTTAAHSKSVAEIMEEENFIPLTSVGTGENVEHIIDLNLAELDNITDGQLAPGAYGEVVFKLLSRTSRIKGYKISVTPRVTSVENISNYEDSEGDKMTEETLSKLVTSHIKFYAKCDETETEGKKRYSEAIAYSGECAFTATAGEVSEGAYPEGISGDIEEKDEPTYVTLYWYWPYEYTDIPDALSIDSAKITLRDKVYDNPFYTELSKYGSSNGKILPAAKMENYDWDDTRIGNLVKNISIHFDVETIRN